MKYLLIAIVCFWLGYKVGWANAHYTVAREIELLGQFFVGEKVFTCIKKKEVNKP